MKKLKSLYYRDTEYAKIFRPYRQVLNEWAQFKTQQEVNRAKKPKI